MAPVYQKIPTHDQGRPPSTSVDEEPNDQYYPTRLTDENRAEQVSNNRTLTKRRLRRIHFIFIGLFTAFYMAFFIARGYLNPHAVSSGTRIKCHETMHRLGLAGHMHYHGTHRNMSIGAVGGRLPTHYTLPSGDKIPSVALGARPVSQLPRLAKFRLYCARCLAC